MNPACCRDELDETDAEEVLRRWKERQPMKVESVWDTRDEGFGEPLESAIDPDIPTEGD